MKREDIFVLKRGKQVKRLYSCNIYNSLLRLYIVTCTPSAAAKFPKALDVLIFSQSERISPYSSKNTYG